METLISPLSWQIALGIVFGAILVWLGRLIFFGVVSCFLWISEEVGGTIAGILLFISFVTYGLVGGFDSPHTLKTRAEDLISKKTTPPQLKPTRKPCILILKTLVLVRELHRYILILEDTMRL